MKHNSIKFLQKLNKEFSVLWKRRWRLLIIALVIVIIGFAMKRAVANWSGDISGWGQLIIEALTLPAIAYELNRISRELRKTADIDIGVVGIKEYPLSNIRSLSELPTQTAISQGYPLFCLVVRNRGELLAKFVKIHLEFVEHKPTFKEDELSPVKSMAKPVIEVPESDSRNLFKRENNLDFGFRGGADWILRPFDSEKFDFFVSSYIATRNPDMPRERPYPSICQFICTVWAEGLENPVTQRVEVEIERYVEED